MSNIVEVEVEKLWLDKRTVNFRTYKCSGNTDRETADEPYIKSYLFNNTFIVYF